MINLTEFISYKDGEYTTIGNMGPSVLDFGFIHCDATYDVMPIYNGRAFCYDRHLQRFKNSASRYGLTLPDVDFLGIIKELYNRNGKLENAFVWFLVWRGYPPSGNPRDIDNCPVHFAMYIKPSYPLVNKNKIKVLPVHAMRVNDRYFGQEFKNMSWIDLTLAQRMAASSNFDTCILIDDNGMFTEGPGFNVGFVDTIGIQTPAKNCLKGITMTVVEDIAKDNGISFERTDIPASDWNNMDEIFLTSSSGGITPVVSGPITELLMKEYEARKIDDRYSTAL